VGVNGSSPLAPAKSHIFESHEFTHSWLSFFGPNLWTLCSGTLHSTQETTRIRELSGTLGEREINGFYAVRSGPSPAQVEDHAIADACLMPYFQRLLLCNLLAYLSSTGSG
jgi:hypothetical protein